MADFTMFDRHASLLVCADPPVQPRMAPRVGTGFRNLREPRRLPERGVSTTPPPTGGRPFPPGIAATPRACPVCHLASWGGWCARRDDPRPRQPGSPAVDRIDSSDDLPKGHNSRFLRLNSRVAWRHHTPGRWTATIALPGSAGRDARGDERGRSSEERVSPGRGPGHPGRTSTPRAGARVPSTRMGWRLSRRRVRSKVSPFTQSSG